MADPSDLSWWFGGSKNAGDYANQTQYRDQGYLENLIRQGISGAGQQQAPQADQSGSDQWRNMQMGQAQNLQRVASGQQAGAGELAVNRQVGNALAAQQAQARMARGGNSALAYRNAATNSANVGLAGAGQAQQAALSDQQAANAQLTQALQSGRSGDQQLALANLTAKLQQQGMNDQQIQAYLSQLTGMNANQLNAQVGLASGASPGMFGSILSAGGQLGGAAIMASDERLKTDIVEAGPQTDEMLDNLKPYSYRYKDEKYGEGERLGIMAQALERSGLGRAVVQDTPEGKMLDVNKALSAALAGTARLNERVRELERKAG